MPEQSDKREEPEKLLLSAPFFLTAKPCLSSGSRLFAACYGSLRKNWMDVNSSCDDYMLPVEEFVEIPSLRTFWALL